MRRAGSIPLKSDPRDETYILVHTFLAWGGWRPVASSGWKGHVEGRSEKNWDLTKHGAVVIVVDKIYGLVAPNLGFGRK
jgi:hypothetical protein